MSNTIPENPGVYIHEIRKHLWANRAVVMVGAGFSKNAEPRQEMASSFPSWGRIVEKMLDDLHPGGLGKWDAAQATAQAPEIADQYQQVFGRGRLRDFIHGAIPDKDHTPGDLHQLLLNLPWQDVFTTNYDTLLERSRPDLQPEQFYDLVRSSDQLPYADQPRIIKLHGDLKLPDAPLIITREDYRTYPKKFAAFVNTVRQALMENIVVLVGFSGTDPNFRQWLGWVRDVLRERRHRAYLCGLLNLSEGARAVFARDGVVPVDLASVVPPDCPYPHKRALRWLFCSLHNGRPSSGRQWPRKEAPSHKACTGDYVIDAIPPDAELQDDPEWHDENGSEAAATLRALTAVWKHNRDLYPGWMVMPYANRAALWRKTESWLEEIEEHREQLPEEDQLRLASEVAWRLCRSMRILETWLFEWAADLLNDFEPRGDETWTDRTAEQRADWSRLAFMLLREHRNAWDREAFEWLAERLESLVRFNPAWEARWHYEHCLYYLGRGHHRAVREHLRLWDEQIAFPFWSVRKASVMAELGDIEEAREIVEEALDAIRYSRQEAPYRIHSRSQEGLAMLALLILRGALDRGRSPKVNSVLLSDRWDELALDRCDPRQELRRLEGKLRSEGIPGTSATANVNVDPETGRESRSHKTSFVSERDWQPAVELLRTIEDGGIPIKVKFTNASFETSTAAFWLRDIAAEHALSTLIRSTNLKKTLAFFEDQLLVAPPDLSTAEAWHDAFETATQESLQALTEARLLTKPLHLRHREKLNIFLTLLGRLAPHLSEETRANVLDFAIQVFSDIPESMQRGFEKGIRSLFAGTLQWAAVEAIGNRLTDLFSLPLDTQFGRYVDPFRYLSSERMQEAFPSASSEKSNEEYPNADFRDAISSALDSVFDEESGGVRARALRRLYLAYRAGILQSADQQRFGEALWDSIDDGDLPDVGDYHQWIVLLLPSPDKINPQNALKGWLTSQPVTFDVSDIDSPETWIPDNPTETIRRKMVLSWIGSAQPLDPDERRGSEQGRDEYVQWHHSEVEALIPDLRHGLEALKRWRRKKRDEGEIGIGIAFRGLQESEAFNTWAQVPTLLRRVLIPALQTRKETADDSPVETEEKQQVYDLITGLIELRLGGRTALPEWIDWTGERPDEAAALIQRGFYRPEVRSALDAAEAVYRWSVLSKYREGPPVPEDLVAALVRYVTRQGEALAGATRWTSELVQHTPEVLSRSHLGDLASACVSILKNTEPPDLSERLQYPQEDRSAEFERRIKERKRAAELGLLLYGYFGFYSKQATATGPAEIDVVWLKDWQERIREPLRELREDPYPQVQHMWKRVVKELEIENDFSGSG